MKDKVLFLVHVEDAFRDYFKAGMLERINRYARRYNFYRVVHFTSYVNNEEPVEEIKYTITDDERWGWGYEPEVFETRAERRWVIASSAYNHEWTWVPPLLRKRSLWTPYRIYLGGGCDGECLADMECVLNYQRIRFRRLTNLIYNASKQYAY